MQEQLISVLVILASIVGVHLAKKWVYKLKNRGVTDLLNKGAVIIDVRTPAEFAKGHHKGALNIEVSKLHQNRIPAQKDQWVICCCASGGRSLVAKRILMSRGYERVYDAGPWNTLPPSVN